jgi:carbamoylphosphate synthase small subunit
MAAEVRREIKLEIEHVFFTAIVGYSELWIDPRFQKLCEENSK